VGNSFIWDAKNFKKILILIKKKKKHKLLDSMAPPYSLDIALSSISMIKQIKSSIADSKFEVSF